MSNIPKNAVKPVVEELFELDWFFQKHRPPLFDRSVPAEDYRAARAEVSMMVEAWTGAAMFEDFDALIRHLENLGFDPNYIEFLWEDRLRGAVQYGLFQDADRQAFLEKAMRKFFSGGMLGKIRVHIKAERALESVL